MVVKLISDVQKDRKELKIFPKKKTKQKKKERTKETLFSLILRLSYKLHK